MPVPEVAYDVEALPLAAAQHKPTGREGEEASANAEDDGRYQLKAEGDPPCRRGLTFASGSVMAGSADLASVRTSPLCGEVMLTHVVCAIRWCQSYPRGELTDPVRDENSKSDSELLQRDQGATDTW